MENKELTGKFYDIQGFSVHDGPGIRLTLFLKGCPLRCPWCHSPESQEFPTELNWMEMKCVGIEKCGNCLNVCPHNCIKPGKKKMDLQSNEEITVVDTDRTNCDNCGKCIGLGGGEDAPEYRALKVDGIITEDMNPDDYLYDEETLDDPDDDLGLYQ